MRAAICHDYDAPLRIDNLPDPEAGPGQVVVDVEAGGLNYVDALIVRGQYQIKFPTPFGAGSELAGTIRAVGPDVDGWAPGDRVFAMSGTGAFAQQALVGTERLSRIPDAMTAGQAAAFTQSYSTALFSLRDRAGLREGETLLVLGGAGGVGRATIDVGKALGARVIAAASSKERLEACLAQGADDVIDYGQEDLKTRARELSGGGVDLALDPVGGPFAEQALRALGTFGRLIVIGFAAGDIPRLPANQVLLRNRSVVGVDWGAWMLGNPAPQQALLADLLALVDAGKLHPAEPTAYALDDVEQALDDLLGRRVTGKAVVTPG